MKLHSEISLGWLTLYVAVLVSISGDITGGGEFQYSSSISQKDSLEGKWILVEYFQDRGDGTGEWIKADAANGDTISFLTGGKFKASETSPFTARKFDRYKLIDSMKISFTATGKNYSETYPYVLETPHQLLIYPLCREKCMRKYKQEKNKKT